MGTVEVIVLAAVLWVAGWAAATAAGRSSSRLPLVSRNHRVMHHLHHEPGFAVKRRLGERAVGTVPLVITPVLGAGFNASAYVQGVLANVIAFYAANVLTPAPLNVSIVFTNTSSGLGQSEAGVANVAYSAFAAALVAQSPSAVAAGITVAAVEPATGSHTINVKLANLRAVGLAGPSVNTFCNVTGVADGCISVNLALTDVGAGGDGSNDLLTVLQHEINEVLGLGSSLPDAGDIFPQDLYRWAAPGVRSHATNPSTTDPCGVLTPRAYLSTSPTGATGTNLTDLNNCQNGGDYGDWATVVPPVHSLQNAFADGFTPPAMAVGSVESIALELIGYRVASPTTTTSGATTTTTTTSPSSSPSSTAATTTTTTTTPTSGGGGGGGSSTAWLIGGIILGVVGGSLIIVLGVAYVGTRQGVGPNVQMYNQVTQALVRRQYRAL